MLLTHPDRLCCCDDLEIDCAGDEFDDPCADRRFDHTPYLAFVDGRVVLDTCPQTKSQTVLDRYLSSFQTVLSFVFFVT